jgi:hypothetical protein
MREDNRTGVDLNATPLMLEIEGRGCQRWRNGRSRHRLAGEAFDTHQGARRTDRRRRR